MIYYPLSVLMLAGIREILIITTPHDLPQFRRLLGDGARARPHARRYAEQPEPDGLAQAFLIGADHVGDDSAALVLGDNIFYGHGLAELLQREAARPATAARCSATTCSDPERYGVVEVGRRAAGSSRSRRSRRGPKSNCAVTGLYFYDNDVVDIAARADARRPAASWRSPTSTRSTCEQGRARLVDLGRGFAWLDTGTHDQPARGRPVRAGARAPAGRPDRLPRGDRAADGLHRRRRQAYELGEALGKSGYGAVRHGGRPVLRAPADPAP